MERQFRSFMKLGLTAFFILAVTSAMFLTSPKAWAEPQTTYRIGPSDILEIIVWREDALSFPEVLVRPDGRITLPLLDDMMAAGLTPMQLKEIITKALKRFVEAPKVYVIVKDPRSQTFSVLGNVVKPGRYPMLKPTTVLQGLSIAEGFNEWANDDEVVIVRGVGSEQKLLPFEYDKVVEGETLEQNIILHPGDVIIVP